MTSVAEYPLRRRSVVWHVVFLATAWLWAGAVVAFYHGYHFAQPSSPWITVNGHTYYTHPPAQTLAQRDHVSAEIVTTALAVAVGLGTLDLMVRLVRRTSVPGIVAIVGGGMLMVFSLFGLLRGLAAVGSAGLLVVLSGLPLTSTAGADSHPVAGTSVPAGWRADPSGRYDLRYWDGASWSSHVSTAGRGFVDGSGTEDRP